MRPTRLASFVLLALLTAAPTAFAQKQRHGPFVNPFRPPNPPAVVDASGAGENAKVVITVKGFGTSKQDAIQDGLERAQHELATFLVEHGFSGNWKPAPEYINSRLVKRYEQKPTEEHEGVGEVQQYDLVLEIGPKEFRAMEKKEREAVSGARMFFMGKILAGVLGLLAAVAGYFRLEEATKGYYTAWLRIGVIGFLGAICAGLLILA